MFLELVAGDVLRGKPSEGVLQDGLVVLVEGEADVVCGVGSGGVQPGAHRQELFAGCLLLVDLLCVRGKSVYVSYSETLHRCITTVSKGSCLSDTNFQGCFHGSNDKRTGLLHK